MDISNAEKIYEGKFSIVYRIQQGGKNFILKQLHPRWKDSPQAIENFKSEANAPSLPGISPGPVDYIRSGNDLFIVREYIEGITLKYLHQHYTKKKYHNSYRLVYKKLADKLSQLHSHGIIHGDIKPSNILLATSDFTKTDFDVYLLDLGLALRKNDLPIKNSQAPLHFSMWYGAPELMLNEPGLIGEHTDLFSMGICMYESFSGEFPYMENHPAVLLQMMLAVPLRKRRKIPGDIFLQVETICAKPGFTKPVSYYSEAEIKEILQKNIEKRKIPALSFTQ